MGRQFPSSPSHYEVPSLDDLERDYTAACAAEATMRQKEALTQAPQPPAFFVPVIELRESKAHILPAVSVPMVTVQKLAPELRPIPSKPVFRW